MCMNLLFYVHSLYCPRNPRVLWFLWFCFILIIMRAKVLPEETPEEKYIFRKKAEILAYLDRDPCLGRACKEADVVQRKVFDWRKDDGGFNAEVLRRITGEQRLAQIKRDFLDKLSDVHGGVRLAARELGLSFVVLRDMRRKDKVFDKKVLDVIDYCRQLERELLLCLYFTVLDTKTEKKLAPHLVSLLIFGLKCRCDWREDGSIGGDIHVVLPSAWRREVSEDLERKVLRKRQASERKKGENHQIMSP
jgi:hypothetical protein